MTGIPQQLWMAFGVVESAVRKQTDNARGAIYVDSCKIGCSGHFDSAVPPGSFSLRLDWGMRAMSLLTQLCRMMLEPT